MELLPDSEFIHLTEQPFKRLDELSDPARIVAVCTLSKTEGRRTNCSTCCYMMRAGLHRINLA